MLKTDFNAYCDTYQKLLAELINLHNYHLTYKQRIGFETGLALRKSTRKIVILAKELSKLSKPMYIENRKNILEEQARKKEELNLKRQKRKERLAQKALKNNKKGNKNGQHNPSASRSI